MESRQFNFTPIMNQKWFAKVADYLRLLKRYNNNLEYLLVHRRIGRRLYEVLRDSDIKNMDEVQLVAALFRTARPLLFAERLNDRDGVGAQVDGTDWTRREFELLSGTSKMVENVTAYSANTYNPQAKDFFMEDGNQPLVTLMLVNGALIGGCQADYDRVMINNIVDSEKFEIFLQDNLLPALQTASLLAGKKGNKTVVTLPILGAGEFSGGSGNAELIKKYYTSALTNIIKKSAESLTHIKAIVVTGCDQELPAEKICDALDMQLYLTTSFVGLYPASKYEELNNLLVCAILAGDPLSFPGNDIYKYDNKAPKTSEGRTSSLTNLATIMTGYNGLMYFTTTKVYEPAQSTSWIAACDFGEAALRFNILHVWDNHQLQLKSCEETDAWKPERLSHHKPAFYHEKDSVVKFSELMVKDGDKLNIAATLQNIISQTTGCKEINISFYNDEYWIAVGSGENAHKSCLNAAVAEKLLWSYLDSFSTGSAYKDELLKLTTKHESQEEFFAALKAEVNIHSGKSKSLEIKSSEIKPARANMISILSANTVMEIEKFDKSNMSQRLRKVLRDSDIAKLTTMQFIDALHKSLSFLDADAKGYSKEELVLLGRLIKAVEDVTVFTKTSDAKCAYNQVLSINDRQTATLIFANSALLVGTKADFDRVIKNGKFDAASFEIFLEDNLLPALVFANDHAKARGSRAVVTLPVFGGGLNAGAYKQEINHSFKDILISIINKLSDQFTHIDYFVLTGLPVNSAVSIKLAGNKQLYIANENIGLAPKIHYPKEMANHDVYAVVSGERLTHPCSIINKIKDNGITINSQESAVAIYTSVCGKMLGVESEFFFDGATAIHLPKQQPFSWLNLGIENKATLNFDQIYICQNGESQVMKFDSNAGVYQPCYIAVDESNFDWHNKNKFYAELLDLLHDYVMNQEWKISKSSGFLKSTTTVESISLSRTSYMVDILPKAIKEIYDILKLHQGLRHMNAARKEFLFGEIRRVIKAAEKDTHPQVKEFCKLFQGKTDVELRDSLIGLLRVRNEREIGMSIK